MDRLAPVSGRDSLQSLLNHVILDYGKLKILADGLRVTGLRIGATIGSYDLMHIGHSRYLMEARSRCDILIVGVDSDVAIRAYKKNENLPLVPQEGRLEMLLHTGYPDYVTLIDDIDENGQWQYGFLEAVGPDIFVTSVGSYPDEQLAEIRKRCNEVVELPRQADTSTTELRRQMMIAQGKSAADQLRIFADRLEAGEL